LRGQHFMSFISSRPQVVLAVLRFLADRVRHTTTVLEETIVRAVQLTHGTVTESAAPAAMLGASAVWSIPTAPTQPAAQEHAPVVAGDVPLSLTGAFAKIAATLDQRTGDQERKQANGAERPARDREPTTRLWTRLGRDGEDKDTGDNKKDMEKD
ncbi:MAG: hypothetical protein IT323_04325, partial [Anaerolineae bacterium]|nr:hypothetical protein [Anaerolineae bacterium]